MAQLVLFPAPMKRLSLALAVLLVAPRAFADDEIERVRTLFDEAGQLERQGQWGAAQERLRSALRIRETPQLHYALGWALENDDRLLEAKAEYEAALKTARAKNLEDVLRLATTRIDEVDRNTPEVKVRAGEGAQVSIDGRVILYTGDEATAKVDPGSRVIRVERRGQSGQQTVYVPRGVSRTVEITADAAVVAVEMPRAASRSPVPWVLVGVGGALVVGSTVLFLSSSGDASTRDSEQAAWCQATACTGTVASRAETDEARAHRVASQDAADRGNTKQIAGAIMGIAGAASIVTGAVMLVRQKNDERPNAMTFGGTPLVGGGYASAAVRF